MCRMNLCRQRMRLQARTEILGNHPDAKCSLIEFPRGFPRPGKTRVSSGSSVETGA